eukprot:gene40802-biopygen27528
MQESGDDGIGLAPQSALVDAVVGPEVLRASRAFLTILDEVTVDELCRRAQVLPGLVNDRAISDFTI